MTFVGSLMRISTVGLVSSVELHCSNSGSLTEVQGGASHGSQNFRGLQQVLKDMMCAQP